MTNCYEHLFKPITVNGHLFRNRIISLPNKGKPVIYNQGIPTDSFIAYLSRKARGGAAQVTVGDTSVDPERASPRWAPISLKEENYGFLNELSFAIKQHGAVACIELAHSGPHANPNGPFMVPAGRSPMGPDFYVREDGVHVEAMNEEEILHTVEKFAEAAYTAKRTGFDSVLIHGGHGWLLGSFLSPRTNHRTDSYGGSFENRARFPMMTVEAVREAVGPDFLIEYRISADEMLPGGLKLDESTEFIRMIQDKIDLVNVSGGVDQITSSSICVQPTQYQKHAFHLESAAAMKQKVDIPVIALGAINTPELAEDILASGKADFIGMSRALIADPDFPNKAKAGKAYEISVCNRCMRCVADAGEKKVIECSVNPLVGRENRLNGEYATLPESKRVLVVGGGIAGMTAALRASRRGHKVVLAEKTYRLGGILLYTDYSEAKEDIRIYRNNLITQIRKSGIDLRLETEVTKDNIADFNADAIIFATGSVEAQKSIPGDNRGNVYRIPDVYSCFDELGDRITVIGGLSACEFAVEAAKSGKKLTVVSSKDIPVAGTANRLIAQAIREKFEEYGINYCRAYRCSEITENGVIICDQNGALKFLEADSVVLALGRKASSELYESCCNEAAFTRAVGDCVKPRQIKEAISEAYFAASDI